MGLVKIINPKEVGAVVEVLGHGGLVNLQPGETIIVGDDEARSLLDRYPFLGSEEIERPTPPPVSAPQPEVVSEKGKRKYARKAKKN